MKEIADKLSRAIDDLLLTDPRKTLVVEPEVQELLHVARLRRKAGRMFAAAASRREETWRGLDATLEVR
ncbi:MAG: hypothetical protein Q8P22_04925 [Chloroflexota bacterium]|nr:hypothetical protein [Chloroflexota bacterium]